MALFLLWIALFCTAFIHIVWYLFHCKWCFSETNSTFFIFTSKSSLDDILFTSDIIFLHCVIFSLLNVTSLKHIAPFHIEHQPSLEGIFSALDGTFLLFFFVNGIFLKLMAPFPYWTEIFPWMAFFLLWMAFLRILIVWYFFIVDGTFWNRRHIFHIEEQLFLRWPLSA